MNDFEDLIYFAGYTDGDGCFSITTHKNKHRPIFVITAANFKIISCLIQNYGGFIQNSKQKVYQKPVYQFRKYGKDALNFVKNIYPYLVQRKEECKIFISFFEIISKNKKLEIIQKLKTLHRDINLISFEDIAKLKIINSVIPTKEDLIYVAGFIDAECSLGISKYKPKNKPNYTYKILLQLNDTKSTMFYWIKSRFGGFCCYYKRTSRLKDQITWRLSAKSLYPFLKNIYPYLRFKKPVCEKLIEFYETTLKNGGARHTEKFRNNYAFIIQKRESIIQEVHKLNQKGL